MSRRKVAVYLLHLNNAAQIVEVLHTVEYTNVLLKC